MKILEIPQNSGVLNQKILSVTVIVTAFGLFVDMFDMFLFNMLRIPSLTDLGFTGKALTEAGLAISNAQFAGFLLGAWICGVLADRYGRKKMLYIAIILYSIGSLLSAISWNVPSYAFARFTSGLGLAGELGTGITLIAETLPARRRGYGALLFSCLGLLGVITAACLAHYMPWRMTFMLGGLMGLTLLFTRMLLPESGLYAAQKTHIQKGGLRHVWRNKHYLKTWISALFLVAPAVFAPQILWTLSPEIAIALNIQGIQAPFILAIGFFSALVGEILAIGLSEYWQSRKKAALLFVSISGLVFAIYILAPPATTIGFYIINALMGLTFGGWVLGTLWITEQFGTNLRATVATTVPNFARALTIPMNLAYGNLKLLGPLTAISLIGVLILSLAFISTWVLRETYGRDLDFSEEV